MTLFDIFPRTTFVHKNDIGEQLRHVRSEADESMDAFVDNESAFRIAEELVDTIVSSVTGLRILAEKYDVDVEDIIRGVNGKNQFRGYHS